MVKILFLFLKNSYFLEVYAYISIDEIIMSDICFPGGVGGVVRAIHSRDCQNANNFRGRSQVR